MQAKTLEVAWRRFRLSLPAAEAARWLDLPKRRICITPEIEQLGAAELQRRIETEVQRRLEAVRMFNEISLSRVKRRQQPRIAARKVKELRLRIL